MLREDVELNEDLGVYEAECPECGQLYDWEYSTFVAKESP
jgi:hypothetical protein